VAERPGDNNDGRAVERTTIAEAATLLGCHPNTIRNRVKAGMYRAEKVLTENGPTWMIDRDSLTINTPTTARQQSVSAMPVLQQEALQELARQIVKEALITRDPEEGGRRENDKARAELWRTIALLYTALLAGIAATVAFFGVDQLVGATVVVLVASVVTNLSGLLFAFFALVSATIAVGADAYMSEAQVASLRRRRDLAGVCTAWLFGVSVLEFMLFVGSNLNALRP
jgi:hypothetical protein